MKTVILSIAAFAAVLSARAEWLSWCVSDTDDFGEVDKASVAYMRVGYVTSDGQQPMWQGTSLKAYTDDGSDSTGDDGLVSYSGGDDQYKVNITEAMKSGDYSFYIELLNSSGQIIGRTGDEATFTYAKYSTLGKYVSTGDIGDVPSVEIWHGGGFQAVPEPSSLALLALGAGLVGLRRRLKRGKTGRKGPRA